MIRNTALLNELGHADVPGMNATIKTEDFIEHTFDNLVDHFNYQDDRTYSQRYWDNQQYWIDGGPVFVYLCGESRCAPGYGVNSASQMGASLGARLLILEHRYYGDSQPMEDWSIDNLKYLSSQQAMADIAYFIGNMNRDTPDAKVVVVGGSYPGALAAWFRARYPTSAIAAWASSAVVQPIVDFWQYDEQVHTSTLRYGEACPKAFQDNIEYVDNQAALREQGQDNAIDRLIKEWKWDENMTNEDFAENWANSYVGNVQYGKTGHMCEQLLKYTADHPDQEDIMRYIMSGRLNFVNAFEPNAAQLASSTDIDPEGWVRQWSYQYCTEFGFLQTVSHKNPMRSKMVNEQHWRNNCKAMFPELDFEILPKAENTLFDQGGANIQGTNIFFTNGIEDPWQWATQRENRPELNQRSMTSDCDGCGHCANLSASQRGDPRELTETREEVARFLQKILEEDKHDMFLQ